METKEAITPKERREFREVVGLFDSVETLQSAIDDLLTNGFDRSEISLLAEDEAVREKIGLETAAELEDDPATPRMPYVENESLNEGKASLIGILFYVGAVVGAIVVWSARSSFGESIFAGVLTGLIASLIGIGVTKLIRRRQRDWARAQLARGGLLLWARTWTDEHERAAVAAMQRNGGHDVHVHGAAREAISPN